MSDERSDQNAPIDAEYELAESAGDEDGARADKPAAAPQKASGPGWLAFAFLLLVSLSALGLGLWSSGLLQKGLEPTPEATGIAAISDRQGEIASRLDTLESDLAALAGNVSALEQREPASPAPAEQAAAPAADSTASEDLAALEDRIASLETRLETLAGNRTDPARLERLEAAIASAGDGNSASESEVAGLREDITALETALAEIRQAQSGLTQQLSALSDADAAIETRIAERTQAALALSAIETAAGAGEPYPADLARRLAAATGDAAGERLETLSGQAIATLDTLRADFTSLKPQALARVTEAREPGWMETLFGETVSVRRSEPESPTARQLSQAEAHLDAGRLGDAIAAVEALPDTSRPVFAGWLAAARNRQQLDGALDAIRLKLISD